MHVWDGECHVHAGHPPGRHRGHACRASRRRLPDPPRVRLLDQRDGVRRRRATSTGEGVHMLSTGGMLKYAEQLSARATRDVRRAGEDWARDGPARPRRRRPRSGMLYPLRMAAPGRRVHPRERRGELRFMKMITLPKLRDALRDDEVRGARATEKIADEGARADRPDGRDQARSRSRRVRSDAGDRELVRATPRATAANLLEGDRRRATAIGQVRVDVLAEDDRAGRRRSGRRRSVFSNASTSRPAA